MNIFCHKCGNKLETTDGFCQSCGAKIVVASENKHASVHKSLKRTDLEKKAWYRALKVIYIVIIVIAVLAIGAVSWSSKPEKSLDGEKSIIACNNGKSYAPSRNSIYLYGEDLSFYDDEHARILCKYDSTSYYSSYFSGYIEKNYTFNPVYEDMKYGSWIGYTILAFFILWLVSYLIKIGFFYIAIGEKPKINIE